MITIKEEKQVETMWINETAWDLKRDYKRTIYLFGIPIKTYSEKMECSKVEPSITKNMGFVKR